MRTAKGILSFFITGVFATVALMVWGWWFLLWIFIAAVALTVFGEAMRVMVEMYKEEGSDRP